MTSMFLSGPFTGQAQTIRGWVRTLAEPLGYVAVEKVNDETPPESVADLIENADLFLAIWGSTDPAIRNAWGHTLPEEELRFAVHLHKPGGAILIGDSPLQAQVGCVREMLAGSLGDACLSLPDLLDVRRRDGPDPDAIQEHAVAVARALRDWLERFPSVARPLWRREVFLSYASEDTTVAESVRGMIEETSYRCWRDKTALRGSEPFWTAIESAILGSGATIVLVSKASAGSQWVRREVRAALDRSASVGGDFHPVVPISIDGTPIPALADIGHLHGLTVGDGDGGLRSTVTQALGDLESLVAHGHVAALDFGRR